MVYSLTHGINRAQNATHLPINIVKPIDKATPLLGTATSDNEVLHLTFDLYRTSSNGHQEIYFSIEVRNANIKHVGINYPHIMTNKDSQPEEMLSITYQDIKWVHHAAGTTGYSLWEDRVY